MSKLRSHTVNGNLHRSKFDSTSVVVSERKKERKKYDKQHDQVYVALPARRATLHEITSLLTCASAWKTVA